MNKYITTLLILTPCIFLKAQDAVYQQIPIRMDTAVQWAGESYKVVDLSPKSQTNSLKKWYLEKIKKGTVNAFQLNSNNTLSSISLSMPELRTPDWQKGLSVERPENRSIKEWYFVDEILPKSDYNRFKYRVGGLALSNDPCCGCDEAEAFAVKQQIQYKNGKFSIHNIFISPLCARQTTTSPYQWYPLCHVAYNDKAGKNFSFDLKDTVFINSDVVTYEFGRKFQGTHDSILTPDRSDIGSLIYQDILKGNLKAVDDETGEIMPVNKLLTIGTSADTVVVYNDDFDKVVEYKVVQNETSPAELSCLRITQDFYFDFKKERMFSVVRSVYLMRRHTGPDGQMRGYSRFCRLE